MSPDAGPGAPDDTLADVRSKTGVSRAMRLTRVVVRWSIGAVLLACSAAPIALAIASTRALAAHVMARDAFRYADVGGFVSILKLSVMLAACSITATVLFLRGRRWAVLWAVFPPAFGL